MLYVAVLNFGTMKRNNKAIATNVLQLKAGVNQLTHLSVYARLILGAVSTSSGLLTIKFYKMSKTKKYEIETLEQLVNITTPENFERLSIDFLLWLNQVNQTFAKIKEREEYKGKINSDIAKVKFIWIDDGKNELKNIQLKNTTTGEVKNIKPKKK